MSSKETRNESSNAFGSFFESMQNQNNDIADIFFKGMQQNLPFSPTMIGDVFVKASHALLDNPSYLFESQGKLYGEINRLWESMLNPQKQTSDDSPSDRRFHHNAWDENPYFRFMRDYYLITSRWFFDFVTNVDGLDEKTNQKLRFYMNQLINAVSPTNFPMTNPEVLEELMKTQGSSLAKGFENLIQDIDSGQWMKMTDPTAFKLGKTLATTQGEVVFRHELFELIHYKPLTEKQYSTPLLIIPPWINKFYIFDLSPNNSYVKWMLEQGHDVFLISWINPTSEQSSKTFEDYLLEGAYRACDVVTSLTQQDSLHTMGYCVGGNLLLALSAYLDKVPSLFTIKSQTLLATIIDFDKIGDLKVFIDESHLKSLEKLMEDQGVLDTETLKSVFGFLRPNDLVWSFFIKNYLLGQVPPAIDFLYWNSDATRLPATLHQFVLRQLFQENRLIEPGGIKILGVPLDIRTIKTPTFVLSTLDDHISPWQSCYPLTQLMEGPCKFVLGMSGHVAGVMNPPVKKKYGFFTNDKSPDNPEEWLQKSKQHSGSWWPTWSDWIISLSEKQSKPLSSYPSLGPAPGTYVLER